MLLCCVALRGVALLFCVALCCVALRCVALRCAVLLCRVALRCAVLLRCVELRCAALYVALCCAVLCSVALCCAVLYSVALYCYAVALRCVVALRGAAWRCVIALRLVALRRSVSHPVTPPGPPSLASCVTLLMQLPKSTQTEQLKLRKFATSPFPGVSAQRGPAGRNRVARLRVPSGGRGAPLASPGWPCVQSGDQGALRQRSSHTPGSPRPLRRGSRALRGTCSPCGAGQSFHMTPREMTGANVPVSDHHRGQCSAFRGPYFFSKS